jgi:hypothetical protein
MKPTRLPAREVCGKTHRRIDAVDEEQARGRRRAMRK